MNLKYWLPNAEMFVRPLLAQNGDPRGLELVMVGLEINWKAKMEIVEEDEDEGLPDLE